MSVSQHRSGPLKQQNKTHKTGRHKSKGKLEKENKGRVALKSISHKSRAQLSKQDRRNHASQLRKRKREELLNKKRNRGTHGSPPLLVSVVSLCHDIEPEKVISQLKSCDETATLLTNDLCNIHISVARFKQRFTFIAPDRSNLYGMLDAAKVVDIIVFVVSANCSIDRHGEFTLSCLFAQGLPSSIVTVQNMDKIPPKKQSDARKLVSKNIEKWFPDEKLHSIDNGSQALCLLRVLGSHSLRPISLREKRPHLLAENISYTIADEHCETGELKVTGYLRGRSLSANSLVHLPGWGDFQLSKICAPSDPYPLIIHGNETRKQPQQRMEQGEVDENPREIQVCDPATQESLQSEFTPDPLDAEMTWPTEEEIQEAVAERKAKRLIKRVPKGTSEYQAAWITDACEQSDESSEDGENSGSEDEEDDAGMGSGEEEESDDQEYEEYEEISSTTGKENENYDADFNMDEDQATLEKLKAARMDAMFPDELDTPKDIPARERFQKYRGLKSFRTSPWDPKENLPEEYARIYQFENFKRTRKRILNTNQDEEEEGALPGWYIQLHINNVPRKFMESYSSGSPVVVYGLLKHEQKMSVINMTLKRHPNYETPVRSKEPLVLHVGYRRYQASPIYSQHTNADKFKYERFLPNEVVMATVFAPIVFAPAPVLAFRADVEGVLQLVGTGSVHSVNPDRVVTKRVVLSGHPFRINRRSAVIRYMFFDRDDIKWFKPIELRTKYGRRGHIKEPLGTHGHMKCFFDKQLTSMDTVLMNLYKRVYPKWTYQPQLLPPPALSADGSVTMDTEIDENLFE